MNTNVDTFNVVGIGNEEACFAIQSYLDDKKRKSSNTYKNYVRYYTEFFRFSLNKDISQVTWNDIYSVTYGKVEEFKKYLLDNGSANYTNQKLFACRSLWKKLYMLNHEVDVKVFDFEEEDVEEVNYASLDSEEIEKLFELMNQEKTKPLTKRLFFEFLYVVASRKQVALNLEWKDITKKKDHKHNIDVWVVRYHDKGKWVEKAINDDFYNKLLQLKTTGESTGNKVFDLNKNTFESMFKKFQDKYDLHMKDGKKVCIHSIKKASGWLVQNTFGDLNKTRKHLQHKNIQLTAKIYMGDENYTEQGSYLIGKDITKDFLEEMSKEDIIKLIEASGKDVIMKLYYQNEGMEK